MDRREFMRLAGTGATLGAAAEALVTARVTASPTSATKMLPLTVVDVPFGHAGLQPFSLQV